MDAREATGAGLLEGAGIRAGDLDLLSGGPPCQGFSKQRRGSHLFEDPRNGLVLEYARLVRETAPRAFLFENVKVVGQKRGRELVDGLADILTDWDIHHFQVDASDFGLAQTRGRFLMIGLRRDLGAAPPILLKSAGGSTVRDAIGDLPPPPDDCSDHPDHANHGKARLSALNIARIRQVPQGGEWRDLPLHLRMACHTRVEGATGGWPDVFGRLEWEGRCPTLTGGFDSFTRGRYGHPEQDRPLTLREGARLQGFPDSYVFHGTRQDIKKQIGNAVPPPLARAAGEAILASLEAAEDLRYAA